MFEARNTDTFARRPSGWIINLVSVKQVCLRTARKLTMEAQEKTVLLPMWFPLGSHVFVCSDSPSRCPSKDKEGHHAGSGHGKLPDSQT